MLLLTSDTTVSPAWMLGLAVNHFSRTFHQESIPFASPLHLLIESCGAQLTAARNAKRMLMRLTP